MRPLIGLVAALILAAPATHAANVASSKTDPDTVLLIGDSLSSAHRIPMEAGWVSLLQARLDATDPQAPLVINASFGGKTVADALKEMPDLLSRHRPSRVIVELGANDAILGTSEQDLSARLTRLIDMAKASGAQVALLGFEVPPKLDGKHVSGMLRGVYARVARDEHIPLVPSLMAGVSDHPALLLDDGVHPNVAAQKRVLDNAWSTLQPLLLK